MNPVKVVSERSANGASVATAEPVVGPKRLTGAEYSAVRAELNAWGGWIERRMDFEGYPSIWAVEAYMEGCGGGEGGHRILCLDMPNRIYAIHGRVLRLSELEREAVWIFYVFRMKPDGTVWDLKDKCAHVGLTEDCVRKRIQRAYPKILGLP